MIHISKSKKIYLPKLHVQLMFLNIFFICMLRNKNVQIKLTFVHSCVNLSLVFHFFLYYINIYNVLQH